MTSYNYSTQIGEKDAAAVGRGLPISTKQAIEICRAVRGEKLERAKVVLAEAINEKVPIAFRRFTNGIGHKKGNLASGAYPKKACSEILRLLNSAQANAQFKGLSSADLVVRHISAQKDSNTPRYGRRRRFAKRTTIEIVLTETEAKKTQEPKKKEAKPKVQKEAKTEEGKSEQ
ncbi:50S ribosomal protein L22 [Candidatus Woesearchaeota archaeon]|nr:50S ribosomal protein L22 [Candidatus Woesearchaeota archaeon]